MSQKIYKNFANSQTKKAQAEATLGFYDSLKLKFMPKPKNEQSHTPQTVQNAFSNHITYTPKPFTLAETSKKTVNDAFLTHLAFMRKLRKAKRIHPVRLFCATVGCSIFLSATILTCHHFKTTNFEPAVYAENEYYKTHDLTQHPLTIYIDQSTTTPEQIKIIQEAIIELDEALKTVDFKIEQGDQYKNIPLMINLTNTNKLPSGINIKLKVSKITKTHNVLGTASNLSFSPICGEITIEPRALNTPFKNGAKAVVQHEILHILGLSHSKSITSIMYPENYYQTLTEKDIADVETIFPPKTTHPEK